jgi:hypothetical protein
MKNSDQSAFAKAAFYHPDGGIDRTNEGLTKREYFAGLAMQGLLVRYKVDERFGNHPDYPMVAEMAVREADELLKQLEQ